jgi:hypothetical protein
VGRSILRFARTVSTPLVFQWQVLPLGLCMERAIWAGTSSQWKYPSVVKARQGIRACFFCSRRVLVGSMHSSLSNIYIPPRFQIDRRSCTAQDPKYLELHIQERRRLVGPCFTAQRSWSAFRVLSSGCRARHLRITLAS